jgi:hypothetical protein
VDPLERKTRQITGFFSAKPVQQHSGPVVLCRAFCYTKHTGSITADGHKSDKTGGHF